MTTPLPIQRFSHVCIRVTEMERSLAFYESLLGFDVVFDVALEGASLVAVTGKAGATGRMVGGLIGGTSIELLAISSQAAPPVARSGAQLGYTNISFSVSDLDAARDAVIASSIGAGPIVDIGGVRMFFVADPDGTPIEIIEYPNGATTSAELWRGPS